MTRPITNRSRLLFGCGSAALALALTLAPQSAAAQAINAEGNVVDGFAFFDDPAPGQTVIDVVTDTAIIDWQPFVDNNGDALDFLPTGNTVTFTSGQLPTFAVLNRILPTANGNVVVIDGTVLSRVRDQAGNSVPGGFVAFYSPTGILVGSNATFDVGSLLLTTLEPTTDSFPGFAAGSGPLELVGATGSTARIQINQGAQITASAENSFFAVVAADVQMAGTALVNGSHAYVAGELVNLTFSNGLFDIEIPVGTAAGGTVLDLGGTIGGPSSSGPGDNHMIYGVAAAGADPISLLLRGNLGFEPAAQAGIVNGEIIISANYDVFGRIVNGGSISDGLLARFSANAQTSNIRADIAIEDIVSTSSLLAISSHATAMRAFDINSSVAGNLLLVGRESASLDVTAALSVTGDVLVSADAYGLVSGDLASPSDADALAGSALISATEGGTLSIGGDVSVRANAFAGLDLQTFNAGRSIAGSARFLADTTGTITVTGRTRISADAFGTDFSGVNADSELRGGLAELAVAGQGEITLGDELAVTAEAIGLTLGSTIAGSSLGGTARVSNVGGTLNVNGDAFLSASAIAADSFSSGDGALADAGEASLFVEDGGQTRIAGLLSLSANALGGTNVSGRGGDALGGVALARTFSGGSLVVEGFFSANAEALGGSGIAGGNASGGVAGAIAVTGSIDLQGDADAIATAVGGAASFGAGGDGGNALGGTALLRADGNLNETATLAVAGDVSVRADGIGGVGGITDGTVRGGRGGRGQGGSAAIANQADEGFAGGAYLLGGGDNGTLSVGGFAGLSALGEGGRGGDFDSSLTGQGPDDAGDGGEGVGGWAQAGLALLDGDGSLGQGSATFGFLQLVADGLGGSGGFDQSGNFEPGLGLAGSGSGGTALLTASAGAVTADEVNLSANGFGGFSNAGATGQGGSAGILGELGGSVTLGVLFASAQGFGGSSAAAVGGNGTGGEAFIRLQGIDLAINGDAFIDANGFGGFSGGGDGGDGTGGTAYIGLTANTPGSGTITGNASIVANGFGGGAGAGATGGTGRGGLAYAQALAGSTVRFGTAQITATGVGGQNEGFTPPSVGGDGIGGTAELRSLGSGSQLIIERNFSSDFFDQLTNRGAIVAANGIGERTTGGSGIGGAGTGGSIALRANLGGSIALPADPLNDPDSVGFISLLARGFGGASTVDGGTGGIGTGGNAIFEVDGGTLSMGRTNFSVFGVGGNGLNAQASINGGAGVGGTRLIRIVNGGTLTAELFAGGSGATGGNGTGAGNGGDATGGSNRIEIIDGTLNSVGLMFVVDQAFGGSGNAGGNATAGTVEFVANNATIDFAPDAQGNFGLLLGGQTIGGNGVVAGGDAFGEAVSLVLQDSTVTGGNFRINPLTVGGNASGPGGIGGSATAVSATFTAAGSSIELTGETVISADATGGNGGPQGSGGVGGNAESGAVTANFTNSQITLTAANAVPGRLVLRSQATGGAGDQTGSALSDIAQLQLFGGNLSADEILVQAQGFAAAGTAGQSGGAAESGLAEIFLQGDAVLDAGLIALESNALTSTGGTARAGRSVLQILSGSTAQVTADNLRLFADAQGADPGAAGNFAGQFVVNLSGGALNLANLNASAQGDALAIDPPPSQLIADGGAINVSGNLDAVALGTIQVRTGQGGIIGSPANTATSTLISLTSEGLIEILGDDDAAVGLGGQTISLTSRDLDILAGARIGAEVVSITSLETGFTAVLGGDTEGEGFTLTADEAGRINAGQFDLFVPEIGTNDPNLPDLLIRDLALDAATIRSIAIFAGGDVSGIVRIEGTLDYGNATAETTLSIRAAERIEVVTPGGLIVRDANNAPGGFLSLNAGAIWAADADTIARLQADPNFAGRDELLAVAAQGSTDPLGYLRARSISLGVGGQLLVRNTGTTIEQGGLLVGGGGLSIFADDQLNQGAPLDVFAYGRRQRDDGTFVTGEAFFNEVNFNRAAANATTYLDASAFNDCIINTGECPQPPPPPPSTPELPPLGNPTVIVDPVNAGDPTGPSPVEQDEKFGMDFPERPEAPLISEEPLLDDPVASGSDASIYAPPEGEN